ncbi:oligosaccharide flippase family protein [Wenxinia marina]|uniref:Membrane protein involved in the export of O-antigen and teichoic acid n=1 Tax=Wenxinia marina DSM 24838 TaxID=1123501 RepID=A0A0D0QIL7_9RHOB|nr:oligosaccharide flippase family protein [Wenxinia marina]KIQ70913.1 Membrane protein involved in the export of O-antigen and teichoic acid [Wenxinia marina DSM 24838]GGL56337.1 hypothetical protein GCM10011392_08500 [Wenxinia marina]
MSAGFVRYFGGTGLMQRVARSSAFTAGGFVTSQAIRLASNLILTRLLFPEAFGLMAIVSVFIMGLAMFSDVGVGPSIMSSKRGDDRDFLDTAWTIQIVRGWALFVVACLLTWPVAWFYDEPRLRWFLPLAAVALVIDSYKPTKVETQNRHLRAGRLTLIEMGCQIVGVLTAIALAYALRSVWALVLSNLVASVAMLVMVTVFLPGPGNRLRWERAAAGELIHFGKWIFLSTVCGFLIGQSDKVIIGKYLDLGSFGLYNIGFFLASVPLLLGGALMRRLLIPVYRESPPGESRENFLRVRRMRAAVGGVLAAGVIVLAFGGVWFVDLMYDSRYLAAGGVVVLFAAVQMPALVILTCDQAALAAGDSRRFFVLTLVRAALVVAGLVIGLEMMGLMGAILGLGAANLLAYPVLAWLNRPHGAWDPGLDLGFLALGLLSGGLAIAYNVDAVVALAGL